MQKKIIIFVAMLASIVFVTNIIAQDHKEPLAFTTHTQTMGPLTVKFAPLPVITESTPQQVSFSIENKSDQAIDCSLLFNSIDTVFPVDTNGKDVPVIKKKISVPANGTLNDFFGFRLGSGTYIAHYPLHLKVSFKADGKEYLAHVVRVIETNPEKKNIDKEYKETVIRELATLCGKSYTLWYNLRDEKRQELGSDLTGAPNLKANVFAGAFTRGGLRRGFSLHPPFAPKPGSIGLDFPVKLPAAKIVTLRYATAMRDMSEGEVPSDGVTFRVWVDSKNNERKLVADNHETSNIWQDHQVDLSAWSGKSITLSFEINPGPKWDTTSDGCFLGDLIITGYNAKTALSNTEKGKQYSIPLANDMTAVVTSGEKGLFDSTFAIVSNKTKEEIRYDGLSLSLADFPIDALLPFAIEGPNLIWDEAAKSLTSSVVLLVEDQQMNVTVSMYPQNGLLIIDVPEGNPAKIGPLSLKGAQLAPERVYFGHGFVVEKPKDSFSVVGGGHNLATSHVGFDYENGISLLQGSKTPPRRLSVAPSEKVATLDFSGIGQMALLPTNKGAFQAAIQYRQLCPWYAAPSKGVARKIGRLVFDVWGGRYVDNTTAIEKAFAYGVTDSLFVKHVWQKWGYDIRLPDIWDKNSKDVVLRDLGTFEELTALVRACTTRNVPFALHDNYIDFYPDAEDFSYKYITFNENGQPRKAWVNNAKGVQSYQWRPDLFKPFLDRNLKLCKELIPEVDAYFVDVFCAANVFDYYTQDGQFVPYTVTQKCWKEAFENMGETLSHVNKDGQKETAITISESGDDFLIGSIDGADAQWLQLGPVVKPYVMRVPCEKWERTPWFAAVNHTNFSRHGAGYFNRFAGLRNLALHGSQSDDYICSEILGGLDMMVSFGDVYPGSIRKHWLAQHVVRRLASQEIKSVVFFENDIQRQIVTWSDRTTVFVNRGNSNWKLKTGLVLPTYGFAVYDRRAKLLAGIINNPDNPAEIIEISNRADSFYVNGRGNVRQHFLPLTPSLDSYKILDDGKFSVKVKWLANAPTSLDLSVFVHVFEPYRGVGHKPKGWFAGSEQPKKPTSQWAKNGLETVFTGEDQIIQVPDDLPAGTYHIMIGLGNPKTMKCYPLIGVDAKEMRYSIALLKVARIKGKVRLAITPIEMSEPRDLYLRLMANKTPVTWKGITTLGAVTVTPLEKGLKILPLPTMPEFDVTVDSKIFRRKVSAITCNDVNVPFITSGSKTTFHVKAQDAQSYILKW